MSNKKEKLKKEIVSLIIFSIGLIFAVGVFTEGAGFIGSVIKDIMTGMFGVGAYFFPFILFAYATYIYRVGRKKLFNDWHKFVIAGSLVWTSVFAKTVTIYQNQDISYWGEGGYIGDLIGNVFLNLFGKLSVWLLVIILIILTIVFTRKSFFNFLYKLLNTIKDFFETYKKKRKEKKKNKSKIKKIKKKKKEKKVEKEIKIENYKIKKENKNSKSKETTETEKENKKKEEHKKENEEEKEFTEKDYEYPSLTLLEDSEIEEDSFSEEYMKERAKKLEETLDSFGVGAKVVQINKGPSVTRYELKPETGIKVRKIVNLADDIALNLAAKGIRIEAPIPGKAAIGIEIANKDREMVLLKEVLEDDNFKKFPSKVAFGLGKDISGNTIVTDVAKMPHLLIAGATGSGKSVCINTLISSIIYKADPSEVKLLMIDPKVVELKVYNGIPHLMIPVVTDPKKAAAALNWAVKEMTDRYNKFAENNVRDIKGYNKLMDKKEDGVRMPKLVIIIDELSDLMMAASSEVEDAICRLAQMARAAGIHLVIATQRPSVDVITGIIKANIPSRIAFSVSSGTDSRTIIDMNGAEKLLGKGDMLFYPVGASKPQRIQGAFISDEEVENIVEFIKQGKDAKYDEKMIEEITTVKNIMSGEEEKDEFFDAAVELVIENDRASISKLQREFRIGYNRAARMVDNMEKMGIVGESKGNKARNVLIDKEDFDEIKEEN